MVASFDERAATWDDDPAKTERAKAVANEMLRRVPLAPSMRAMEYGCGTGQLSFMLRAHLGDVTLADLSDGMLDVAARKIAAARDPAMHAVKLDLIVDPMPARFDVIYSAMTLHHIPDTDAILRRFREALVRPGYLCIADLDTEDGSFHGLDVNDVHLGFDRTKLAAQARGAGFAAVDFTTAHVMTKAVAGKPRAFPIFLMVARTGE
jgi:ubiquinone/menaquinone biosynthesis C-methylase UbiE